MGEQAARLTIDRLAAPHQPPVHLEMRARLIVRGSSGPPPTTQLLPHAQRKEVSA
jgi:DNA-binding LacI/PurR family transcriptional regulator